MLIRIGLCVPSKNTANATLGITLSGITTAKGTFRSICQGSEEESGEHTARAILYVLVIGAVVISVLDWRSGS